LRLFHPFRLLLLILLLAFLPVQSWAAAGARAAGLERLERTLPLAAPMSVEGGLSAGATAEASAHSDDSGAQDARSPLDDPSGKAAEGAQAGADLAEQWLPPTPPRLAALPARAGAPRYAGAALPDPDLPLPPRPPRG